MVCLGFEPAMVGADETTELWRPPVNLYICYISVFKYDCIVYANVCLSIQNVCIGYLGVFTYKIFDCNS